MVSILNGSASVRQMPPFLKSAVPLVSVVTVAYEHQKYIEQALNSVLEQHTPFAYELIVADDHSSDETPRIIEAFAKQNPDIVRAFCRPNNLGPLRNFKECLRACRGRYVALLDGDDYWLSPEKLSKQIAELDSHPEYAICSSRARVVYEGGERKPWEYPVWDRTVHTLEDLMFENFIPTCTAVFRLGLLLEFPQWLEDLPFVDWALHVLLAQYGDILVLPETLAAYRVHSDGLWSRTPPEELAEWRQAFYRTMQSYLPSGHNELIRAAIARSAPAVPRP
jgi:glycosyltransferase involved in cell wall biosynthesis